MKAASSATLNSIQKKNRIVLVLLAIIVALMTCLLLGYEAETLAYPYNCGSEEHIHDESCYESSESLICQKDHEHDDSCVKKVKVLTCEKYCHTHMAYCYKEDAPEGVKEALGQVIPYATMIDEEVVVEELVETTEVIETIDNQLIEVTQPVVVEDISMTKATAAIDISDYELAVSLQYYDEVNRVWVDIENGTEVPVDAQIHMVYNFAQLGYQTLKDAGGLVYYTVPKPFNNNTVEGPLPDADGNIAGQIVRGDDNNVNLVFDMDWIQMKLDDNKNLFDGSFELFIGINPKDIGSDNQYTIDFKKTDVEISFVEDWKAKQAFLEVEKSAATVVETEDGAYLEYTLTVKADSSGTDIEDVTVTDAFANGIKGYLESYVGVEITAQELTSTDPSIAPVETKPEGTTSGKVYKGYHTNTDTIPAEGSYVDSVPIGSLIWKVGDMQAGEIRTLTYRAKLSEAFTHTDALKQNKTTISNTAKAYSKTYLRDTAESSYRPNNNFTQGFHKKDNFVYTGEDGNTYVRFRILIEAKPGNDFTYPDLIIRDELFATHSGYTTNEKFKPYVSFVEDSFVLYENNVGQNAYGTGTEIPFDDSQLIIDNENLKQFEFHLGEFEPGKCITLFYDVKVDKGAYTVANEDFKISNTFITLNANSTHVDNRLERYANEATIDGKIWSRKMADEQTTTSNMTIQIPATDEVYASAGTLSDETITSFDVPQGSYRYFIVLNEDGKWDMSNATLTDALGEHLRYSGYVKVSAYQVDTTRDFEPGTLITEVENFLNTQPLIKTTWMKIEDLQSFTFKPNQVGHSGRTAYMIEYYAHPYDVGDVTTITVNNTFTISGDVGDGVGVGGFGSISVQKAVTVTGGQSFQLKKQGWYFEKDVPGANKDFYANGRLFWVLEVNGALKAGREIRDVIPANQQWYYYESMVGVYTGSFEPGKDWEDYVNLEDFETNANVTKLEGVRSTQTPTDTTDYVASFYDNREIWITLQHDIPLEENESMFIIVASTPLDTYKLDYSTLDIKTFNNDAYTRENSTSEWIHMVNSTYKVSSKGPAYKEFDGVVLVNKDGYIPVTSNGNYTFDKVLSDYVSESGLYAEWYININWNGEVNGMVEVSDILPEGMELACVRIFDIGSDYDSIGLAFDKPITLDIPELEETGWIKNTITAKENEGNNILSCTYYYNPDTREVRWNVDNLYYGGDMNSRNVMFQVVTKATSEDLLLPSNEVTISNTMSVKDEDGKITTDTAEGTYTRETLGKDTTDEYKQDPNKSQRKIPFVVNVNTYGIDMNADGDTLTLVDEPGEYLVFDYNSVRVYEYQDQSTSSEEFSNIASQVQSVTTSSNNIDGGGPAGNLYDGNTNSLFKFYRGALTSEESILLKYGRPRKMNQFTITFEHVGSSDSIDFTFEYSILARNSAFDGSNWTTIADHQSANRTDNYTQTYDFAEAKFDEVKIVMHACKTYGGTSNGWPAIAEFAINGSEPVGENVSGNYLNPTFVELDKSEYIPSLTKVGNKEILTITVPDNKWLRIEYEMEYVGPKGQTVSISNDVRWDGMPSESGSSYENSSFQYDVLGGVFDNEHATIKVIKKDEKNLNHSLAGATFTLTKCEIVVDDEGNSVIRELEGKTVTQVTGADGSTTFSRLTNTGDLARDEYMDFNVVYCLKETQAPTGYILDQEPLYFTVAKQIEVNGKLVYPEFPEEVYVYTDGADYQYTALNGRGKIELDKQFMAATDNETILQDGSFKFGLFNEENPTTEPLQILTINVKNEKVTYQLNEQGIQTPTFENIDISSTTSYYIYELDSQNQPIKNGSFVEINGTTYQVKYPDSTPIVVDGTDVPVKVVHNYLTYKLPESGGQGAAWNYLFGFTMILLSVLLVAKRRRNEKEVRTH